MKIMSKVVLAFFTLIIIGLTGCGAGSMSAPPISLPTPVTGRIVMSSPGAEGPISIIGEAGAVTGSQTVMAINTTVVVVQLYESIMGIFVGNVYATAAGFPNICYEAGRECVTANADGSFELNILADEGDEIVVVLIDSNGNEISDRLARDVPQGLLPFLGTPVDLMVNPIKNIMYVLARGGEVDGVQITNRINYIDTETGAISSESVEFAGTGANLLALNDMQLVVTDIGASENTLLYSEFDINKDLIGFNDSFALMNAAENVEPTSLYYIPQTDLLLISNGAGDSDIYSYDFINDRAINLEISLPGFISQGTDVVGGGTYLDPQLNEVPLIAFVTRYSDGSDTKIVLGVFLESEIEIWASGEPIQPSPIVEIELPVNSEIKDLAFIGNSGLIAISDSANNNIGIYKFTRPGGGGPSTLEDVGPIEIDGMISPQKMEFYDSVLLGKLLFVNLLNGTDTKRDEVLAIEINVDVNRVITVTGSKFTQVGLSPSAVLAYGTKGEYLYVSCSVSRTVARLNIADILP